MRKSKKCLVTLICGLLLVGIFAVGLVWLITSAKIALNQNRLAVIQCAIGRYLMEGEQAVPLATFIEDNYPDIEVRTNAILDRYHMPVRYVIEDREDSVFIGIYSSGRDKQWGTSDDVKRESILLPRADVVSRVQE